jgi:hypothetical protein
MNKFRVGILIRRKVKEVNEFFEKKKKKFFKVSNNNYVYKN